jgi:hypothetical protein
MEGGMKPFDAPPCGATRETPEPFAPTLNPWPATMRPSCYWCRKSIKNQGKCSVVTFDGEEVGE